MQKAQTKEIEFKEYITIKEMEAVDAIGDPTTADGHIDLISILTKMDIEWIKHNVQVSGVQDLYVQSVNTMLTSTIPALIIEHNGTLLGFSPAHLGAIGPFASLERAIAEGDYRTAIVSLFRPLSNQEHCDWKFEYVDGIKMVPITNIKECSALDLEDPNYRYDPKFYDDFPYQILKASINFMVGVGILGSVTTPKTYTQSSKTDKKLANKRMAELSIACQTLLDGLEQCSILQRLGYSPSVQTGNA